MSAEHNVHFSSAAEEVEARFHVDIVPGTEIFTDLEEAHFVHGGRGDVVLVPQPNGDPHNPLVSLRQKASPTNVYSRIR